MERLASKAIPPLSLAAIHRFAASVRQGGAGRGIAAPEALQLSHRFLGEQVPVRAARMVGHADAGSAPKRYRQRAVGNGLLAHKPFIHQAVAMAAALEGAGGGHLRDGLERMHERYSRLASCGAVQRSCPETFRTWLR